MGLSLAQPGVSSPEHLWFKLLREKLPCFSQGHGRGNVLAERTRQENWRFGAFFPFAFRGFRYLWILSISEGQCNEWTCSLLISLSAGWVCSQLPLFHELSNIQKVLNTSSAVTCSYVSCLFHLKNVHCNYSRILERSGFNFNLMFNWTYLRLTQRK